MFSHRIPSGSHTVTPTPVPKLKLQDHDEHKWASRIQIQNEIEHSFTNAIVQEILMDKSVESAAYDQPDAKQPIMDIDIVCTPGKRPSEAFYDAIVRHRIHVQQLLRLLPLNDTNLQTSKTAATTSPATSTTPTVNSLSLAALGSPLSRIQDESVSSPSSSNFPGFSSLASPLAAVAATVVVDENRPRLISSFEDLVKHL